MEPCPHLREPTLAALAKLRSPLNWSCQVCASTDGVWLCLGCGHVGCGRRAHLPALGGGHARHHYLTMVASAANEADGDKTCKIIDTKHRKKKRRGKRDKETNDDDDDDNRSRDTNTTTSSDDNDDANSTWEVIDGLTGHEVCIDVLSRAVHCYVCDDYVMSDAPWLASLRKELVELETKADMMEASSDDGMDIDIVMDAMLEELDDDDEEGNEERALNMSTRMDDVDNNNKSTDWFQSSSTSFLNDVNSTVNCRGCTGLRNLGNTCYMNSTLQALSHCSGFRSFFRDFLRAAAPIRISCRVQLDRRTSESHLVSVQEADESPERLALTEATHALLRVLWSGRWSSVSPKAFVHTVWTHSGFFAARRQQDASEFLGFMLNRLDEELRPKSAKNANTNSDNSIGPGTVLTDLFGIDQHQEVSCDGCGTKTTRTEPLLGLMLSLPESDDNNEELKLQSCLDALVAPERLVNENKFHCDKCNGPRDATKTVKLRRCPQALLVMFRRTMWTYAKGLHKDARKVSFPLNFDATELLDDQINNADNDDNGHQDTSKECHYHLVAIVSHSGTSPSCGHYIAWCRVGHDGAAVGDENNDQRHHGTTSNQGEWYLFNDSNVSKASEDDVLQAEAFILLYDRRQVQPTHHRASF